MKKRLQQVLGCLLLCAVLTGGLCVPASAASFQDVPANHWAAASIQRCVEQGFFNGQSTARFGLGQQMTRSAFAVVLCRFFGWETTTPTEATYQDVPTDAWYAGSVEAAYTHGALTDQREHFRPTDPITREELTVMLVRALGYGTIAGLAQDLEMPFRDVTTNAGYITMAYDLGLVSGTSASTFSPERAATREQVAVILMRLYDKLHGEVPGKIAVVSEPADMTGLDVVAIPAARAFSLSIKNVMGAETAAALRDTAHQTGAKALLHITGSSGVLGSNADQMATLLAEAVVNGGYDGIFLDIPQVPNNKILPMTKLVTALNNKLGDKLLYLVVEAPVRDGKAYGGYNYSTLSQLADRLIVRVAAYEKTSGSVSVAPVDPLEEVYYALASLEGQADIGKLSLMVTTTPSIWIGNDERSLSTEEFAALQAAEGTETYYSDRYACAYLTSPSQNGKQLVAWYLDRQAVQARLQLVRLFGIEQFCLSDWSAATDDLLSGLQ